MPFYGKRKSNFKRNPKMRKRNANNIRSVQSSKFRQGPMYKVKPEPFPRELITRCKYVDRQTFTISSTADYASALSYCANNIYQPLYSTGNTTVTGYSTLKAIYNNYVVMGAKVQITFYDPSVDGISVGVRLRHGDENPCVSSTLRQLMAQPMTYTSEINDSGSQKKSFNLYIRPWSLVGMSKLEYLANRSGIGGNFSNDTGPSLPVYFDTFAVNPTLASQSTVKYVLKIMYYIRCFNRNALAYTSY